MLDIFCLTNAHIEFKALNQMVYSRQSGGCTAFPGPVNASRTATGPFFMWFSKEIARGAVRVIWLNSIYNTKTAGREDKFYLLPDIS